MTKYYIIDAFFVDAEKYKGPNDIKYVEHLFLHPENIRSLIVTKTAGGFIEIKTGRFIPNSGTHMSKSEGDHFNIFYTISSSIKRELVTKGACLFTNTTCENKNRNDDYQTIRPVRNLDEVRDYLNKGFSEEVFRELDEAQKKGTLEYKRKIADLRAQKKANLVNFLTTLKNDIISSRKTKKVESQLNKEIKDEIKKIK